MTSHLAFSRGNDIYVGLPRAGFLAWDTVKVDLAGAVADDPALVLDGELLVIGIETDDGFRLFTVPRGSDGVFRGATLLNGMLGKAPSLGQTFGNQFELFFNGETRGVGEPHRSFCQRQ